MASGLTLEVRLPLDATTSFGDLAQLLTVQLVGIIRASTEKLEQRIQQAEQEANLWKQEGLLAQTRRTQEEYLKIQAEHKVEKVKEKLIEAWTMIRKTVPQLPESSTSELVE
jgi:uncharacterized protein YllA (UPF0747 family)